jgi:hypothetical protein
MLMEVSARGEELSAEGAQAELARGLRSFREGKWAEAAIQFEVAFKLDPQPRFLFSQAQAQRLAGDCKGAQATYAAYLKTRPSQRQANAAQLGARRCEEQRTELASLEPRPGANDQRGAPPPQLGDEQLKLQLPAKEKSAPPPTVTIEPSVTVEPAPPPPPQEVVKEEEIPAPLKLTPSPPPPKPKPKRRWFTDWRGGALTASGLAVLAIGAITLPLGNGNISNLNQANSYDSYSRGLDGLSSAQAEQRVGVAFLAIGGALTMAGVLRYALVARASKKEPR